MLVSALFILTILFIDAIGEGSVLNTIYTAASYTYGPLLGMFFFGLFTKYQIKDKLTPLVCVLAPLLCFALEYGLKEGLNYVVGYEILLINGLITAFGLWAIKNTNHSKNL